MQDKKNSKDGPGKTPQYILRYILEHNCERDKYEFEGKKLHITITIL